MAGDGRESLRYLAPYVFRVAIGDHRIVSCDDGLVTFTYRRVGSSRRRRMRLDAMEFLRQFLEYVLPSGLPKVRHDGFLSPASGEGLELVRWLIALWAGLTYVPRARRAEEPSAPGPAPGCAACGGALVRLGFVPSPLPAAFDTSEPDESGGSESEPLSHTAAESPPDRGARRVGIEAGYGRARVGPHRRDHRLRQRIERRDARCEVASGPTSACLSRHRAKPRGSKTHVGCGGIAPRAS